MWTFPFETARGHHTWTLKFYFGCSSGSFHSVRHQEFHALELSVLHLQTSLSSAAHCSAVPFKTRREWEKKQLMLLFVDLTFQHMVYFIISSWISYSDQFGFHVFGQNKCSHVNSLYGKSLLSLLCVSTDYQPFQHFSD